MKRKVKPDTDVMQALRHVQRTLQTLVKQGEKMAGELDGLRAAVARNTSVVGSAMTLLKGLKDALDQAIQAGADPATLQALSTEIGNTADSLAAAVAANTPAAP
jgi:hypothetical protein